MPQITRQMLRSRLAEQLAISPKAPQGHPDRSHVDLLSVAGDDAFVAEAYHRILGRQPDLDGLLHFLGVLKNHPRQIVIDALAAAGNRGAVKAPEPPASGDLTGLDAIDNITEFVKEAYRRILQRESDREGLAHYRALLQCGVDRVQVLAILAASPEGRAANVPCRWNGRPLPNPARLGLKVKLRLLLWNFTWRAQLEEALSGLAAEAQHMSTSCGLLRDEMKVLSAKIAAVSSSSENHRNELLSAMRREVVAVTEAVQKQQESDRASFETMLASRDQEFQAAIQHKLDAMAGDVQVREQAIQIGQDSARSEVNRGIGQLQGRTEMIAAAIADKLDAIAGDMRIREEAIISGLHQRTDELAGIIRAPVLAASDVLVTKVDDFVLAIPREDWCLAAYYAYWGSVDLGLTRHFEALLRPGMIVVDIGANIGLHTLHAARRVGEKGSVYSFEPSPRTFDVLRQNVEASGLSSVELFPLALLDRQAQVNLYIHPGSSPLNTLFDDRGDRPSVAVEAVTLDSVLSGCEHIDLVKIDAEGAEPFILRGMKQILARNPEIVVLIEFAPSHLKRAGIDAATFLEEIRAIGFTIRSVESLTGQLQMCSDEELLQAESSNLHLEFVA